MRGYLAAIAGLGLAIAFISQSVGAILLLFIGLTLFMDDQPTPDPPAARLYRFADGAGGRHLFLRRGALSGHRAEHHGR
jgi:uncharacterized membrane protein YdcZ (DUF606 family)